MPRPDGPRWSQNGTSPPFSRLERFRRTGDRDRSCIFAFVAFSGGKPDSTFPEHALTRSQHLADRSRIGPVAEWRRGSHAWLSHPGSIPGRASKWISTLILINDLLAELAHPAAIVGHFCS